MVSLSTPRSTGPLVTRLASSPRPALVQEPDGELAAGGSPVHDPADGSGGVDQRIELSGTVTVNWAAKAAGLLADVGIGHGDTVLVDLPLHWLSHALSLGALVAGAELGAASPASDGDGGPAPSGAASAAAVLTDRPDRWTDPRVAVFAVTLPRGLDPELGGDPALDPSVIDVAAEIRGQPDSLPGPVVHVRADLLDDAVSQTGDQAEGEAERPRLTLADVRDALHAWDAGRAVTIRG